MLFYKGSVEADYSSGRGPLYRTWEAALGRRQLSCCPLAESSVLALQRLPLGHRAVDINALFMTKWLKLLSNERVSMPTPNQRRVVPGPMLESACR
jgi:hypothetical protein